jgi:hypothetical protein
MLAFINLLVLSFVQEITVLRAEFVTVACIFVPSKFCPALLTGAEWHRVLICGALPFVPAPQGTKLTVILISLKRLVAPLTCGFMDSADYNALPFVPAFHRTKSILSMNSRKRSLAPLTDFCGHFMEAIVCRSKARRNRCSMSSDMNVPSRLPPSKGQGVSGQTNGSRSALYQEQAGSEEGCAREQGEVICIYDRNSSHRPVDRKDGCHKANCRWADVRSRQRIAIHWLISPAPRRGVCPLLDEALLDRLRPRDIVHPGLKQTVADSCTDCAVQFAVIGHSMRGEPDAKRGLDEVMLSF